MHITPLLPHIRLSIFDQPRSNQLVSKIRNHYARPLLIINPAKALSSKLFLSTELNITLTIMTHNTSGDSVDRHEQFLVPFGTKRLTEVPELGMPSTSTFYFVGEDHTLGNVLRSHLLHSSHVVFAGYRVPRPDEAKMEIRVQTDGEITPREAVVEASRELIRFCDLLSSRFFLEFELKKSANAAAAVKAGGGVLGG